MSGAQPLDFRKLRDFLGRRNAILIAVLVITSLVVTGFVWSHKKVNITVDGKTISLDTVYSNPQEILAQADIYLGPKDEFRISTSKLINGTTIVVYRAVPVTVLFQDKTEVIITGKPTVGEVAASLGYSAENSKVIPGNTTEVTPMMQIRIIRVTEKMVTKKEPVPSPIVRKPDDHLEKDVEEVIEAGHDGIKEATVKVRFEDGQEVGAETVAEKIISQPKPQLVKVGTRDTVQTSRGAMRFRQVLWMEATAYNPTDGSSHGITATGIPARHGVVAVDPDVIPLGSRVYVPGYGMALAADTGGDINGDRIDLCMEGYEEAWSFGRRMVKVYVIAD